MTKNITQLVANSALNHIIQHGAQLAKDNKTIKNHLFNFSNNTNLCITNNLVAQAGVQQARKGQLLKQQVAPLNMKKDFHSSFSANVSPSKTANRLPNKKVGMSGRQTGSQRSSTNNRSQFLSSRRIARTSRQRNQNRFIDLSDILKQPDNGRKVTKDILMQEKNIQTYRDRKISEQERNRKQKQENQLLQKMNNQRIHDLKLKINKHMKDKNNNFTFDNNGDYIMVSHDVKQKSIKRRFPPSNLNYILDQPQQPKNMTNYKIHIKQKAARGQAFASAVLKTMNMSKFSLNLTTKTCNIDQFAFMKRNDLFNNNHSRQVTTIPYLQVTQGTNYTQTHTNMSVNRKKTPRTSHSQTKGKFKNHSLLDNYKQNSENHNKTEAIQPQHPKDQIEKRRIQSSKTHCRPRTSVPISSMTTDRITSVNQHLVFQLIQ